MSIFKPVDMSMKFAQLEANILKFWQERDIFHKSLTIRENVKDSRHWVFYEGPPTANGKPHPGHVLTRVIKDLFPRYKTMRGYYVPRKAGWDTHGLPVEIGVEKDLHLNGKTEIEKYGIEAFARKCMESVFRYTTDWENLTKRIGFWIDLKDAYITYHQSYVESVWWSLKELHTQNLLYKGHKILPWCPHCQTALSSHEVGLGYKEVEDPSVFVTFRVCHPQNLPCNKSRADESQNSYLSQGIISPALYYPFKSSDKVFFLAWTTTPWTLPSNVALAIRSDINYSYVKIDDKIIILATDRMPFVLNKIKYEEIGKVNGNSLCGISYEPLFAHWKALDQQHWQWGGHLQPQSMVSVWTTKLADFVTLDTGTGIVHVAPAFGADDYALWQRYRLENLPFIQLVNPAGAFIDGCGAFVGRFVKDADKDLIKDLKERGLLFKRESIKHDYPFCWRCDTPLIYYARGGWFIRTTSQIQRVIENNQKVDWHPSHIRDGRFGSFLESNIDWALSRERYWGTPLPIWLCECGHQEAIASFKELKHKPGAKGCDAFDIAKKKDPALNEHLRVHKPWIDAATFACSKCGKEMRRASEVIDCWYDSGAMPFAQWGYPHAPGSKEKFNLAFPADFISEAIDQTRGWFYSLITEATLLKDSFASASEKKADYPLPYKTCLVLGHVGDEKGEKLSKSNPAHQTAQYDPNAILDEEGADALRWFFYSANNPWTSARFSRAGVREAQKEFLLKLRNVYSFFVIYANIDGFDPSQSDMNWTDVSSIASDECPLAERPLLDRWILSELHKTIASAREHLDNYNIYAAAQELNTFVESLSNWHVRRSRERFWSSWQTADKGGRSEERGARKEKREERNEINAETHDKEKLSAYYTLYECLLTMARLAAPFTPFMCEEMWQNLARAPLGDKVPESVHLCDYPESNAEIIDELLAEEIALTREVASLGRAARANAKIKTRQPLSAATIAFSGDIRQEVGSQEEMGIIIPQKIIIYKDRQPEIIKNHEEVLKQELNVKSIVYVNDAADIAEFAIKPNFKAIGVKHRELVPLIKKALAVADATELRAQMISHGKASLSLDDGKSVDLQSDEVEITLKAKEGYTAASGQTVVVALDIHLTDDLRAEGVARELVNRINGWRGDLNLAYEQRIKLALCCSKIANATQQKDSDIEIAARKFAKYICEQTVALELELVETLPPDWQTLEVDVDGKKATLALSARL